MLYFVLMGVVEVGVFGVFVVMWCGVIVVVVIGNWLEFFDFIVYGFFVVLIGKLFFLLSDLIMLLLLLVVMFVVGFFMWLFGSVVFGVYVDCKGCKVVLNLMIMLMVFGIGLIVIVLIYV